MLPYFANSCECKKSLSIQCLHLKITFSFQQIIVYSLMIYKSKVPNFNMSFISSYICHNVCYKARDWHQTEENTDKSMQKQKAMSNEQLMLTCSGICKLGDRHRVRHSLTLQKWKEMPPQCTGDCSKVALFSR